jgi:hypothetical protein
MNMSYTLEDAVQFLSEKRSKTYKRYVARISQEKIVLSAKNDMQARTCFGLERHGV